MLEALSLLTEIERKYIKTPQNCGSCTFFEPRNHISARVITHRGEILGVDNKSDGVCEILSTSRIEVHVNSQDKPADALINYCQFDIDAQRDLDNGLGCYPAKAIRIIKEQRIHKAIPLKVVA